MASMTDNKRGREEVSIPSSPSHDPLHCSARPEPKRPRSADEEVLSKPSRAASPKPVGAAFPAPKLGLADLFGVRGANAQPRRIQRPPFRNIGGGGSSPFFTFRLEHRTGGPTARHRNEERILLFRSDRPGVIAKIIYSSNPSTAFSGGKVTSSPAHLDKVDPYEDENYLNRMAQAKIHVLDVKEPYRGRDLGGLLFHEAIESLRIRYGEPDRNHLQGGGSDSAGVEEYCGCSRDGASLACSVRCQLDAEEDVRRHNKLVTFYKDLGCVVKQKAKVLYLNNNDGETYRKVPMQTVLGEPLVGNYPDRRWYSDRGERGLGGGTAGHSLVGLEGKVFLPVTLLESSTGEAVSFPSLSGSQPGNEATRGRRVEWLLLDDGAGGIQFRTTMGQTLRVCPDGSVGVSSDVRGDEGDEKGSIDKTFRLTCVPDFSSSSDSDDGMETHPQRRARGTELWALETQHGTYLTTNSTTHSLETSKTPSFCQADSVGLTLSFTTDTPPRRKHYRETWARQGVEYVRKMRQKYTRCALKKMGLREALDLAKDLPAHPFCLGWGSDVGIPSVKTLCFQTAEAARKAGYPDWVQFVALVHELGRVMKFIENDAAASDTGTEYDWTLICRSRVVGCPPPARASFSEFRTLNPDETDSRYNSAHGMYDAHCGLESVLLTWSGPEYMHLMLKHNNVAIPDEGLAMLRLFSLGDWHIHGEYEELASADDKDAMPFVSDFDRLRRRTRRQCSSAGGIAELSESECDRLWEDYYSNIVAKYNCGGLLQW